MVLSFSRIFFLHFPFILSVLVVSQILLISQHSFLTLNFLFFFPPLNLIFVFFLSFGRFGLQSWFWAWASRWTDCFCTSAKNSRVMPTTRFLFQLDCLLLTILAGARVFLSAHIIFLFIFLM